MAHAPDLRTEPPAPSAPMLARETSRGRLLADRAAVWVVRGGGGAVLVALIGILVFLLVEALPLARSASIGPAEPWPGSSPSSPARSMIVDPYLQSLVLLGENGEIWTVEEGVASGPTALGPSPAALVARATGEPAFVASGPTGQVAVVPIAFATSYDGRTRTVRAAPQKTPLGFELAAPPQVVAAAHSRDATTIAAALGRTLRVARIETARNDFTGETSTNTRELTAESVPDLEHLIVDPAQRRIYGSSPTRGLLWWDVESDRILGPRQVALREPSTAIALLDGGKSLAVGHRSGDVSVWFAVRRGTARTELVKAHEFATGGDGRGAVSALRASQRNRTFLATFADESFLLLHSTSENELASGTLGPGVVDVAIAPKGDALVLLGPDGALRRMLDNPHPEASALGFFRRVWYESYPEPAFVWQSTGGTDEFESKLSLVPLVAGTLKGTLYALLIAIPLGILGALYTSQFLAPAFQRAIKPVLELMASLPSVVLGFLAGLWLAPRLEAAFAGLLAAAFLVPAACLAAGAFWQSLPRALTGRLPTGSEMSAFIVAVLVAAAGSAALASPLETWLFAGDFSRWLGETTGTSYDQRNAIVAGVAMGVAVIPIIFAISEDSLSNVPRTLVAGSLALGATRWQTTLRVVVPAAAPGLFAAVMIGLGRAIGETMIVLMATGNTPLIDWNPFTGLRTLSANIAVEIPEAPHASTLYRTLFLSALILFALTFAINTAAELVRERMRKRYAGS